MAGEGGLARRGHLARSAVLVPLLALVLSACATIPTSGPVRQGRDLAQEPDTRPPRSVGRGPSEGDGPEAIVRGFLQSSADFLDDHFYAREYLAPGVRAEWDPSTTTGVYDRGTLALTPEGDTITVQADEVGRIDVDGSFHRVAVGTTVERTYRLTRSSGQWRIAALDDGLLLSTADLDSAYREFNLYFVSPTRNTVVPDPVLLPDLPGLASKLVARLLQGPTADLRDAVTTSFPQDTRLEVNAVPVRDGVATVRLDSRALNADSDARVAMSAQLVWTLRQLPEVSRIRILAAGDDLVTSGVQREQPRTAWPAFDPDIIGSSASLYVDRGGLVGQVVDGRFSPAAGDIGSHTGYDRPAVSLLSPRIAVTDSTHTRLYLGQLTAGARAEQVQGLPAGADLSVPSWDSEDNIWVANRRTGRVYLYDRTAGTVHEIPVPRLPAGPVQVVRVARDGTRIAFAAGTAAAARLYLGAISRDAAGDVQSVEQVHEVLPELTAVVDLAWVDADTLIALGVRGQEPLAPVQVDTSGLDVDTSLEPLRGLVSVTAAPPSSKLPIVAGTDRGQLQSWDPGLGWVPLTQGKDPNYPG